MNPTTPSFTLRLRELHACANAVAWAEQYPDAATAWNSCQRGDWMLWLCGKLSGEPESDGRKKLVLAACECARLALSHWTARHPNDNRVAECVSATERWAQGKATIKQVITARKAAYDAAYAAYDAAAYAAAYAAYAAAYAAYAAAYAAYAAYAATAACDAAYAAAAADADAGTKTSAQCADIVRKHYPVCPIE